MTCIWIRKQDSGAIGIYTQFFIDCLFTADYVSVNGITPQGKEEVLGKYESEQAATMVLNNIESFINKGNIKVFNMPEPDAYTIN